MYDFLFFLARRRTERGEEARAFSSKHVTNSFIHLIYQKPTLCRRVTETTEHGLCSQFNKGEELD